MTRRARTLARAMVLASLALAGCAGLRPAEPEESPWQRTERGSVIVRGEFEFERPPWEWSPMVSKGGGEFDVAFFKYGGCPSPCQSTFAYDEEPFGYSRDPKVRLREFMRRFLWASHVVFGEPRLLSDDPLAPGRLVAAVEGSDPIRGQKVRAKLVFFRRGERVVSFYFTQWRPLEAPFDPEDEAVFDRFVRSFRYLKPSFYETL